MLETRLLYYFLAVAREENITKAARSLNITQSTLSKQMMELEEQLGKKLFVRGKRQITLTEEGEFLKKRAREVLDLVDGIKNVFSSDEELMSGEIRIACGETATMERILEIFKVFHNENPEVKLRLFSGNADAVLERLDKGLADIGLLFGPKRYERYDYFPIKETDRFGLLLSTKNSLAKRECINLETLAKEPLILSEQLFSENEDISFFGGDYSNLNVVATYNLIYNATFLAEKGVGSILCLDKLVNTAGRDLVFVPIEPALTVNLSVVTKKYQSFSPTVKVFLERIKSTCGK